MVYCDGLPVHCASCWLMVCSEDTIRATGFVYGDHMPSV